MNGSTAHYLAGLIQHFCQRDELSTYDPYDIWKTPLGFRIKNLYNRHRYVGLIPAGSLAIFDNFANNTVRLSYRRQEYSIVRAFAALCLINLYHAYQQWPMLEYARRHLEWLLVHRCQGYNGWCWGLGFPHAVSSKVVYTSNTPFSTITPYVLEAFIAYKEASGGQEFDHVIQGIMQFFDRDIQVMEEDKDVLATSYGPFRDRTVTNAVSYALYSYSACLPYAQHGTEKIRTKIRKLYEFIRRNQRSDGSWLYAPQNNSFVDCFHSCIVLKNLIKASRILELSGSQDMIRSGYNFLLNTCLDRERFLFRRFAVKNKPGLIKYDLYDNAEALNLLLLLGERELAQSLLSSILKHFCRDLTIYSQIDLVGALRSKNTLRWAVMPFLYAASQHIA